MAWGMLKAALAIPFAAALRRPFGASLKVNGLAPCTQPSTSLCWGVRALIPRKALISS